MVGFESNLVKEMERGGQAYFRDAVMDNFLVSVNRDVLKNCSVNRD